MEMHGHEHHEHHEHTSSTHHSPEETLALLGYMLGHNEHHTTELLELSEQTTGEASALLREAVEQYKEGNRRLAAALALLKGE